MIYPFFTSHEDYMLALGGENHFIARLILMKDIEFL